METKNRLLLVMLAVIACTVNVAVAFMSDGLWKTAGNAIAAFYWQRACAPAGQVR